MMTSKNIDRIIELVKENNPRNNVEIISELLAVKQVLERLEKLEKFVDIYKHTKQRFTLLVQAPYSDLPNPTMEQELIRLEVLENDK